MTCADIQQQLSEWADRTLPPDTHATIEGHLSGCPACSGVAEDLRRLRDVARTLGRLAPPDSVWREISFAANTSGAPRLQGSTAPRLSGWLLVAAVLLMAISLSVFVRSAVRGGSPALDRNAGTAAAVKTIEQELRQAEEHYQRAIAELEAIRRQQGSLDPAVDAALTRGLTTIDAAIAETRQALAAQASNEIARASLFDALKLKVAVLQAAVVAGHGKS